MPDTSALQALYSALIQGGATILAILGAFLLTFGAGQSSEPDEVPHKRYQKIVAFSHTAVTLFVLVLFCVTVPATLLAWLPNDRVPFLRSVFAITAYSFALFSLVPLVAEMRQELYTYAPEARWQLDMTRWRDALIAILIVCTIGILFADLIPLITGFNLGMP